MEDTSEVLPEIEIPTEEAIELRRLIKDISNIVHCNISSD